MKLIRFGLMFGQWSIIYVVLLVLAMEIGILAGPRIRFSFTSLWWIIFAVTPIWFAILFLLILIASFKKIRRRFYLHVMPYVAIVGMAILATLLWGWMFEITAAYIIIHFVIAAAIHIVEFVPRIYSDITAL